VNIIIDHIPYNTPFNRRPKLVMRPQSITVHSTGNTESSAQGERGWLENPTNKRVASWHYVVDENRIIEAIPPTEVAWHAGDGANGPGNRSSISIEMCESGNREIVLANTRELIKHLMEKHNIRKVVRHYDWTRKNCPRILNRNGVWTEWNQFLADVYKAEIKEEKKMLEKAIVIGGFPDMAFAEVLAARLKAPIYTRSALPAGKIAKEVYVAGGSTQGIQADKVISLTGKDRFAVARAVEEYLKK
jgi:N-acetylmuramoyl-L-alanine amidase